MAKLKLKDLLTKHQFNLDEEINVEDPEGTPAEEPKQDDLILQVIKEILSANSTKKASALNAEDLAATITAKLKEVEPEEKAYEEGFYSDGQLDITKVKDPKLVEAFEAILGRNDKTLIDHAYNTELAKRKLSISEENFKKILDTSKVTVVDGKVKGMAEAFKALEKSPGIYKVVTTPMEQGYNPVDKKEGSGAFGDYASFEEAYEAQIES